MTFILGERILFSMNNVNISHHLSDDEKGYFVEGCIYDYYESKGFPVNIVQTKNAYDSIGQKLAWDKSIIVPDILVEDTYNELFFIESKSFWQNYYSIHNYSTYQVEKRKLSSYLLFYNKVFPRSCLEGYSNVYIGFCDCVYDNLLNGTIYVFLVPFENLVDIYWTEEKGMVKWFKKDIQNNSVKKLKIDFNYDSKRRMFSSKFTNNILERKRNVLFVTKESIDKMIEDWEDKTCSW